MTNHVMTRRVFAVLAICAALLVSPASAEEPRGGGGDNVVLVFNSTDGAHRARSGLKVSPTAANVVDNENVAYAKSSDCTGCRTVAVAVQAVLITGDPDAVTPKNVALALNENCTSCSTMAAAYQYVVTTSGPVHVSAEARSEIRQIRRELRTVAASGLPFAELEARLDVLVEQFEQVIDEELVQAGRPDGRIAKRVAKSRRPD